MVTKAMHAKHSDIAVPKDKLVEDLRMVVADAEELLRVTANQAGEGAASVRARINENLRVVKERMIEAEEAVIEHTKQAAKVTDEYVHENPWKAVGASAVVGVVIGMLIARR